MNALILAALLAAPASAAAPTEEDVRCYRAMAELARADDPAARTLGLAAAQYFLGRIDAAAPGFDPGRGAAVAEAERAALLRRCGESLRASGQAGSTCARSVPRSIATRRRPDRAG